MPSLLYILTFITLGIYLAAQQPVNTFLSDVNKLRTSFYNCQTTKNNNNSNLKPLFWHDSLAIYTEQIGKNLLICNQFCYDDKWYKLIEPFDDYCKLKNRSVWVGIWPPGKYNINDYCSLIKCKHFQRMYAGNYSGYTIIALETTQTPESFLADIKKTEKVNYVLEGSYSGYTYDNKQTSFMYYITVTFNIKFGHPCNCDTTFKHIDAKKMLVLVNELRQKGCNCGKEAMPPVNPIIWNDTLEMTAFRHSRDMCIHDYFDHMGLDGSLPTDRAIRLGYKYAVAENIAKGNSNEESAFNGWLHSPGHCKNMMDKQMRQIGVSRSGNYWTMNLGYYFKSQENYFQEEKNKETKQTLLVNEIIRQANSFRNNDSLKLNNNHIDFRMYFNKPTFSLLPDERHKEYLIYGGFRIDSIWPNVKSQATYMLKDSNIRKLLLSPLYTEVAVASVSYSSSFDFCLYRPAWYLKWYIRKFTGIDSLKQDEKIMDIAFKQAKQYWYKQNYLKDLGFQPATYVEMMGYKNIKPRNSEMILVCDLAINTDDELFAYLKNQPSEYEKFTKHTYTDIGYCRYKNVWVIILADLTRVETKFVKHKKAK